MRAQQPITRARPSCRRAVTATNGFRGSLGALALIVAACGGKEGDQPNVLPTSAGATDAGTTDGDGGPGGDDGQPSDGASTGGASDYPATYRFECVDIQILGDADGSAFQAVLLESAWTADIGASKLNILMNMLSLDEAAGMAELQVSSGVGPSADSLCAQVDAVSPIFEATYEPGVVTWQSDVDPSAKTCAKDGAGSDGLGTFTFSLGVDEIVYIYAEDDDGTTFNCDADQDAPDAVPVHAVQATVTMGPDREVVFGSLVGCLTVVEATGLCSCIGACLGEPHPDCGNCPTGARPLASLLEGINPSERCTEIMGEPGLDIQLALTAERLGYVPETCGG